MKVPEASSPARRTDKDAWHSHQRLAHPSSHSLDLEVHLKTQQEPLLALADSLRAHLASTPQCPLEASASESSGSFSSASHARMVAQLHACVIATACMLAVAQAARFEGGSTVQGVLLFISWLCPWPQIFPCKIAQRSVLVTLSATVMLPSLPCTH